MALQGTLDTFSLPDVLRLLATTSKTGRLRIEGDRGQGSVWLTEGGVVDADAERVVDGTPLDEVIFELLRFGSGSFVFDGNDTALDGRTPEDVDALLRRANSLLSEWGELEAVVPSLEHEVSLAADLSADEVTIDADHWRSLVAVASGRTVGELATSLGLTELGVSRAVRDLVDLGVADVGSPGTTRPTHRPSPSTPDVEHRAPAPRPERESVAPMGSEGPATGETARAGWLRTGEVPAVGTERRSASASNGSARASRDDTGATPAATPEPAPADPPAPSGLASRLGRNRNAGARSRGPQPRTTGATPSVTNGSARATGPTPVTPPARTNDGGRARNGTADTGPTARHDLGAPRRTSSDGPTQPVPEPPSRREGRSRPASPTGPSRAEGSRPAAPASPSRPAGPSRPTGPTRRTDPGVGAPGAGPSPFDGGRLGPPPSARDTGQIRPVTPSSLPPDLHWAVDDTGGGTINGGIGSSPFSGLSSLGPSRPAPSRADGEIAPHVAAMSPEARTAVQAAVGNAGGSTGGRGGSQGEDIAQRGRLISFLSTVR